MNTMTKNKTLTLVKIGIMGALASVLMYFKFPLPFFPPFITLDVSEVPILITGFSLGPVAGVVTVLVKIILKLLLQSSSTFGIGEVSNIIVSSVMVIVASLVYDRHKTRKQAVKALALGTLAMALVATLSNAFIIFPGYMKVLGLDIQGMLDMATVGNPFVSSYTTLMLFSIFPFNIIKGSVASLITILLYKNISPFLKRD